MNHGHAIPDTRLLSFAISGYITSNDLIITFKHFGINKSYVCKMQSRNINFERSLKQSVKAHQEQSTYNSLTLFTYINGI